MIHIGQMVDRGWYVSRGAPYTAPEYLHQDGTWRKSTQSADGTWGGYFPTWDAAQKAAEGHDNEINVRSPAIW